MASFEEHLAELETVVERLERGDLSNACKAQLSSAESRVQVLLEPTIGTDVRVEDLAVAVADGEGDEEEEIDEDEEYELGNAERR
jgi:exodeoxyribonuclease VII small subunit